jgi:hypothetical protein
MSQNLNPYFFEATLLYSACFTTHEVPDLRSKRAKGSALSGWPSIQSEGSDHDLTAASLLRLKTRIGGGNYWYKRREMWATGKMCASECLVM